MLFNGFVDDSGSGEGKDRGNVFVLAGFVASAKEWGAFSTKWQKICDREPRTPDFKMKTANRLLNKDGSVFWTEKQRDRRIKQLVKTTKRKTRYRVESLLAWPNYEKVVKGRVPPEFDSPYFLCFYNVIVSFAAFMERAGIQGTVDWVFDDQGRLGIETKKWYDFISASIPSPLRSRLGSTPVFKHDKSAVPLKAADLYAWQIRRHLDKEEPRGIEHNDYLDVLVAQVYGVSNIIEGKHLEEFVRNFGHGLMLKSRTSYFMPPKSRVLRFINYARKKIC